MDFETKSDNYLNIAAFYSQTHTLGPGLRFALWVQGCPFRCKGCVSPDWISNKVKKLINIEDIAQKIINNEHISGITISGGEPMEQAKPLSNMINLVHSSRPNLSIICFTGYKYENLIHDPPNSGVLDFLAKIDLLIDGPYVEDLNNNIGFRGSVNQNFIYLTDKFKDINFSSQSRKVEIRIHEGESFLIGIPQKHIKDAWDKAIRSTQESYKNTKIKENLSKENNFEINNHALNSSIPWESIYEWT